ncbi:MAG: hypothetical protein D6689_01775 [Deltaproteobacteria bacterium]|nr:MAG: hypothetical protein D6689_01775 [Deltaproteobacteria bacterium]
MLLALLTAALAVPASADAQRKRRRKRARRPQKAPAAKVEDKKGAKVFDFTGLQLGGRLRSPQLLYFLDRATEELERASLERRSFIPEMVKSVDEEAL